MAGNLTFTVWHKVFFGLGLLLVLQGTFLAKDQYDLATGAAGRRRLQAVGLGLPFLLIAAAIAALRPPFGPFAVGLLAGGGLALVGVLLGGGPGVAGLAALGGVLLAGQPAGLALPAAAGLAAGAWLFAWSGTLPDRLTGEPVAAPALQVAGPISLVAVGAAFGAVWHTAAPYELLAPAIALALGIAGGVASLLPTGSTAQRLTGGLVALVLVPSALLLCQARPPLLVAAGIGLFASWLLAALKEPDGEPDEAWPEALRDGLLAAAVVAVSGAVAFELGRGLGLCLAALAALAVFVAADPREAEPLAGPLTSGVACLVAWVFFRLCYERVTLDAPRVDLYLHTTLVGLLVGLVLPALSGLAAARFQQRHDPERPGRGSFELSLVSCLLLGLPAALLVMLWGQRAAAAAIAAGVVGPFVLLCLAPLTFALPAQARRWSETLPEAYATMAALAVPATIALADLQHQSRRIKLAVLLAIAVVAGLYALSRAARSRRRSPETHDAPS